MRNCLFNGAVGISSLLVPLEEEKEGSGRSGNQMLNPRRHTHYFCLQLIGPNQPHDLPKHRFRGASKVENWKYLVRIMSEYFVGLFQV